MKKSINKKDIQTQGKARKRNTYKIQTPKPTNHLEVRTDRRW